MTFMTERFEVRIRIVNEATKCSMKVEASSVIR